MKKLGKDVLGAVVAWLASPEGRRMLVKVVVPLLLAGGTVAVVTDPNGPDGPVTHTVRVPGLLTVKVDGPDADRRFDDRLTAPAAAVDALRTETGLREKGDRSPRGVLPAGVPLASPEWPGCRTRLVSNFSQRVASLGGPQVIVWHQTVSHDSPGWASQDALTALASRSSSQVSWHFLIGGEDGLCTFSVPLDLKAWTQSNANSVAVGIEVERFGDEPSYVTAAGERTLLAVTRRVGRLLGIPMQKGLVRWTAGCVPVVVRRGIVEHSDLGPCGGGHRDVTPWSTDALVAKAAVPPCGAKCRRARDLRARHRRVHAQLESARGAARRVLRHRNTVLHRVARREGVTL